jgi:hypothetical protein
MFVVIWQFEIAEDKITAFEAAYGTEGSWAKLFRASPHYLGTELLRDAYIPGAYLTARPTSAPSERTMTGITKFWTASATRSPAARRALGRIRFSRAFGPYSTREERDIERSDTAAQFSPYIRHFLLSFCIGPCYNPLRNPIEPKRFPVGKA